MDVDGELPYPYLMYATGTSVPNLPYMSAGVADLILFIHIYPYLISFGEMDFGCDPSVPRRFLVPGSAARAAAALW